MSFILTYGSNIITLRSPEQSNIFRVMLNDIRRFTRSGTLDYVKDTDHWTRFLTYVYKFTVIRNAESDLLITDLKGFLKLTAGREIGWQDHLLVDRMGFIYTPVNEFIAVRPGCSYDFSFEILETPV